ncbi:MAG: endonuclease MutS2 [Candidatus Zixiibacteriota bacterium]
MIDQHSLETLEFPKIIAMIEGHCLTPLGHEAVQAFAPGFDLKAVKLRQAEVSEMTDLVRFGLAFPLARMEDCRDLIENAQVPGMFLDPKEILLMLDLVCIGNDLADYDKEKRPNFPHITEYLEGIRPFPELVKEIKKAIDERGDIRDDASSKLKSTRLELVDGRRKLIRALEQSLSSGSKRTGLQDDVVTMRNGRYVVSIPVDQFRAEVGILHDRSQSGATLYVEPKEAVEHNNRLNMLLQEERLEMDRILRALTTEIAKRAKALLRNAELIGQLDALHAAGMFAARTRSNRPLLTDRASFALVNARHPLLINKFGSIDKVVPMSLTLDDTRQSIVVTGPNTGGKTVVLKTIGLLVLMAQSGLMIPADESSEIGMFKQVYADIGDEQSLELSLSTFSSHIRNIIKAVQQSGPEALVLLDEIGAGTDPKEGAALAEAIILHIVRAGARLVATTHYSQLKTLPQLHPAIENASLEFDRETLAPTYRLSLGMPGSSYAVEIAGRLGLDQTICSHAAQLVGSGERSLTELISSMESELKKLRDDRTELSERLATAKQAEEKYNEQLAVFKREVEAERQKALAETADLLESTRKETERLVAEIRTTQASKDSVKAIHKTLKDSDAAVKRVSESLESSRARSIAAVKFMKGDNVRIATLNQNGTIEALVGKEKARVRVGNVVTLVEIRNLRRTDPEPVKKALRPVAGVNSEQLVTPEIHLRGMTAEEAQDELDRFLDRAVVSGLRQVYVIHGKGTGVLRRTLTEYLKKHKEVDSIRLGDWNEGGAGVTVVRLKE